MVIIVITAIKRSSSGTARAIRTFAARAAPIMNSTRQRRAAIVVERLCNPSKPIACRYSSTLRMVPIGSAALRIANSIKKSPTAIATPL